MRTHTASYIVLNEFMFRNKANVELRNRFKQLLSHESLSLSLSALATCQQQREKNNLH